jgi:DNA-binding LytR/AlgR family response regulator
MRWRCLLVDDEPPALRVLAKYIFGVPELELVAQCKNALEARGVLSAESIDLMFLDIKMPKMLGTELLRSLPHRPKVIITSAYRDYAAEGFELEVEDYLVKPIAFERFVRAVQKVMRSLTWEQSAPEPVFTENKEAFIYARTGKVMQKIVIDDIGCIESRKDYVCVHFRNGDSLLVRHSMSAMEQLLSAEKFLRVHRSYLVPLKYVSAYSSREVFVAGRCVPIGRLYRQGVISQIAGR